MNRYVFVLLVLGLTVGCATPAPHTAADAASDTSPPHTAEDASRRFSAGLATVFEACKMAIQDIGADHLEPVFQMEDTSAMITAATKTRMYGILLFGYDEYTDVMLILDDKSSVGVIPKSVFDEFWAAVEAHL